MPALGAKRLQTGSSPNKKDMPATARIGRYPTVDFWANQGIKTYRQIELATATTAFDLLDGMVPGTRDRR